MISHQLGRLLQAGETAGPELLSEAQLPVPAVNPGGLVVGHREADDVPAVPAVADLQPAGKTLVSIRSVAKVRLR